MNMNPTLEKYGLDLGVWPKTTFAAEIAEQYWFYKRDVWTSELTPH